MKIKNIVPILLIALILASCSLAAKVVPAEIATQTSADTPTAIPTSTSTFAPTPIGGRDGLLLSFNGSTLWESGVGWKQNLNLIYTYDITSRQMNLLLEGYSCIGVSPDGEKIALRKTENGKTDLFVMDLAKPEKINLLYENVVNTNVLADYSYWFPGSEWIGFITLKDGVKQIFIIHPDGSELTQVTNSPIGAIGMEPVFHEGIYWIEGKENSRGQATIQNYKWTKLDGTEITIQYNFKTVSPSGKYLVSSMSAQNPDCLFCDYDLVDPVSGAKKLITLVKPSPDKDFPDIQPLSDEQLLVTWLDKSGRGDTAQYWIYSYDGTPLFSFADLPHDHDPLPEGVDNMDAYSVIFKNSSGLPVMSLSPDGKLLLLKHQIRTYLNKNYIDKNDVDYYVLNLSTYKIQHLPNLVFDRNNIPGPNQGFYWVVLP